MGKGDKKSRRGKIHIGSYGTRRRRSKVKNAPAAVQPVPEVKPEKPVEPKVKKSVKAVEPVEAHAEPAAVTKKAPRKTTKKAKEEPANEAPASE